MKFLEYTPFIRINGFLNNVDLRDCRVKGIMEAYSCKVAGMDKKLSRSLEHEVLDSLEYSPSSLSTSPVGPLSSSASRKTLIYLILTLNHMYPDYDFSMLRAHHFCKEHDLSALKENIGCYLIEVSKVWTSDVGGDFSLTDQIWNAINEVIELADCDIFSFIPDLEVDPFTESGIVWSFHYFFYNKKLKRVLYFSCRCLSKLASEESSNDEIGSDAENDFIRDMEMED